MGSKSVGLLTIKDTLMFYNSTEFGANFPTPNIGKNRFGDNIH